MNRLFLTAGTALVLVCGAPSAFAQNAAGPLDRPVVQVQANPPGHDVPSPVPPNPESANETVPPAMPSDPSYAAGPYKGALTPAPVEAMNKVYPVCTRKLRDSCRNPGSR